MSFSSFDLLDSANVILVFGKDGQVGQALQTCLKDFHASVVFVGRKECDLRNESALREILNRYQPQVIINAAAYTAVDRAESEPDQADAINAKAPAIMADYLARISHGILVHFSTDYVFSGTKPTPYEEEDATGPLSHYGRSKLAGEQAIIQAFEDIAASKSFSDDPTDISTRYYIFRTSWVYGEGGNFIRTILKLASERDQLKVIADQWGTPTSAPWLAELVLEFVGSKLPSGIYHAVPDGETTWHGLALFAIELARQAGEGILLHSEDVVPIPATEYPLPAPRPYNSRMSNEKLKKALAHMAYTNAFPHWEEQVENYVTEYVTNSLKS